MFVEGGRPRLGTMGLFKQPGAEAESQNCTVFIFKSLVEFEYGLRSYFNRIKENATKAAKWSLAAIQTEKLGTEN